MPCSSQNCLLPVMSNGDLIHMSQVTKSTSTIHASNLNDAQYESFILYNLAKNIDPSNISINAQSITRDLSHNDTNLVIRSPDPDDLKNHILINNDDRFIQSELFAMNVQSRDRIITSSKEDFAIIGPGGNILASDITLTNKTKSYYDSNLKINVSLNDGVQDSDVDNWNIQFDRKYNNMNYFAAINSHLNVSGGSYPFKISEDTDVNTKSLGESRYYFTRGANNKLQPIDLSLNDRTTEYGLNVIHESNYEYTGDEFKSYKIQQIEDVSTASLALTLTDTNSTTPVYYNSGIGFSVGTYSGADIYDNLISFYDISKCINIFDPSNSLKVQNNFKAILTIDNNSNTAGYTIPSFTDTSIFEVNDRNLTNTGSSRNLNYFNNHKPRGTHTLDISNGYVRIDSANTNKNYVTLENDPETLDASFCTTNSVIKIQSSNKTNRVSYPSGAKSSMTEDINVVYTDAEISASHPSKISNELRIAGDVSYNCRLLVESTKQQSESVTYGVNETRNLVKDSDAGKGTARLVIANPNTPVLFDIKNSTTLRVPEEDNFLLIRNTAKDINILNIQQSNTLVNDGWLYNALDVSNNVAANSGVNDVSCNVSLFDTNLSKLKYTDYRIKVVTKTLEDISKSVPTTNNWKFVYTTLENDAVGVTSDFSACLIGDPTHSSELIFNNSVFLNTANNSNSSITVDFKLNFSLPANFDSIANIAHYFDVSSNDPTKGGASSKSFGSNDTKYTNMNTKNILLETNISGVQGTSGYNASDYVFERWLRQRSFNAQIDPNFPIYKNILLQTNTIYEETVYYRGWKVVNGNKVNELYPGTLFFFELGNQKLTSATSCKFVNGFSPANQYNSVGGTNSATLSQTVVPTSRITFTAKDCCIFKANLQAKDLSDNNWRDLGYDFSNNVWVSERADIDPYMVQGGNISNYDPTRVSSNADFNCLVNIRFPQNVFVTSPVYYIDITQPMGASMAVTASLYSLSASQIISNTSLSNYFTSDRFSPYNNDFSEIASYKNDKVFICDLSLNNNIYTLTVTHTGSDNLPKKDVVITFPKDYVLNFNVVHAENDLFSILRTKDSVKTLDIRTDTQEGNVNRKQLRVDDGVYLQLKENITFGMKEVFSLNRDKIHVKMINHAAYPFNSGWGDISGVNDVYKPIVFTGGKLTIGNTDGVNKTKRISLGAVRGYDISGVNANINITRSPAVYKFTLDVSFANPIITLDELYDGSNVYIDLCNNATYGSPVITYPRPINRHDPSWNNAHNWSQNQFGSDISANTQVNRQRYVRSRLQIYRYQFDSPPYTDVLNNANGIDFNDFSAIDTKFYTFARNEISTTAAPGPNSAFVAKNYPVQGESGSILTPLDVRLARSDGSYNYTYEKMTYTQTYVGGNGVFNIDALKSRNLTADEATDNINTITITGSDKNVFLDIGLKFDVKQSILASDAPKHYNLDVRAGRYTYSFQNPDNSININGSGSLFDGILRNFLNFRTRSIKTKFLTRIELIYNSSLIRVFSRSGYDTAPYTNDNNNPWVEIPTSPFFVDTGSNTDSNTTFTLHPTDKNAPYGLKIHKANTFVGNFVSYLVVAPPSFSVEYNSIQSVIYTLPFVQGNLAADKKKKRYIDIRKRGEEYNLFTLTGDGSITNNLYVRPPTRSLYNFKSQSSSVVKNIIINGNFIELSLRNGLQGQSRFTQRVDGSLNISGSASLDNSYNYTVFNDVSNNFIETIYPKQVINNLINNSDNKYRAVLLPDGVGYDVSYNQNLTDFNVTNNTWNVNFTIDNAFVPPNTSYLPLGTSKSTSVTFYDSRINFRNGKYFLILNKFMLGDGNDGYAGTDYNSLLTNNSNISEVTFRINSRAQKVIQLYTTDASGRTLLGNMNLSDSRNVYDLFRNLTANDLSGGWSTEESIAQSSIGISLTALDGQGKTGLQNLLKFNAAAQINNKTLFIERNDILRVNSVVGQPVFRITNSGNLISNKVSTSLLSLLTQSVSLANRGASNSEPVSTGLFSLNSLDFSGNWLDGNNQRA